MYLQIAQKQIEETTGFEAFNIGTPWKTIYLDMIIPGVDVLIDELFSLLTGKIDRVRADTIAITEHTRLVALVDYVIAYTYNSYIDKIWT